MRWLDKGELPPLTLARYLEQNVPLRLNLSYRSFPFKSQLRGELTRQQFGLCAFTGIPVDHRLPEDLERPRAWKAHIAHLKPQSLCRHELERAGKSYDHDLGEDLDHRNLVAALLVEGSRRESFGASAQGDWWDPDLFVSPTDPNCEERFRFELSGAIHSDHPAGTATIQRLRLDHPTLTSFRCAALDVYFDPERDEDWTRASLVELLHAMETPDNGVLPEFSFVIAHIARTLLERLPQ